MIDGLLSIIVGIFVVAIVVAIVRIPCIWTPMCYVGRKISAFERWLDENDVMIFTLAIFIGIVGIVLYGIGECVRHTLGYK